MFQQVELLGARTPLGAPSPTTRSKDATRDSWHRYSRDLRSLSVARFLRPFSVLEGAEEFGKYLLVRHGEKVLLYNVLG